MRSCSLNRENPHCAIETRRDSKNSFFENETMLVFISHKHKNKCKHKHKKNENVCFFLCLCLCLCASENSIRQISGFVLLLMLNAYVAVVLTCLCLCYAYKCLFLCLCASENRPSERVYYCSHNYILIRYPAQTNIKHLSCNKQPQLGCVNTSRVRPSLLSLNQQNGWK